MCLERVETTPNTMQSLLTMNCALRSFGSRSCWCDAIVVRHLAAFSSKVATEPTSPMQPEKVYEQPRYATKAQFRASIQDQRTSNSLNADTGMKPTRWQRRFLVLTNLYRNAAEIPEYVASGTMQRMHNRMRVVFIVVACTWFYLLFLVVERGWAHVISVKKSNGHSVSRMD